MANAASGLRVQLRQAGPIPLDAELHCAPGELLALVGPSGSGKSTILRSVAGLYRPHHGRVTCNGACWFDTDAGIDQTPQARSVGLVFQHYALFPHLRAIDNVAAALGHLARVQQAERARELLALVHLDGLEQRFPAELSGGQQQRVAVARALARDPMVLLLDEPFSAVDQVTRRKLQRELAQLRRRLKMPIVLVTHDIDEARSLADRMCILHHGRTLRTDTPGELLARPGDPMVARLVGLTNLFDGTVVEHLAQTGITRMAWGGLTLEAQHAPAYAPGAAVTWVIPPESVILHRRDRPSRGEHENPVHGVIEECTQLGEMTTATIIVAEKHTAPLSMSVPTHVARRNRLAPGENVTVSLLAEAIHIMPPEPDARPDAVTDRAAAHSHAPVHTST
jgi:molybdate transport system ATP-binding protein